MAEQRYRLDTTTTTTTTREEPNGMPSASIRLVGAPAVSGAFDRLLATGFGAVGALIV